MANRVVDTLSRLYSMAEAWGVVPEGRNPCRSAVKYKERRRERFLTEEEFRRLGRVLAEAETEGGLSAYAVAAIRLLMLTGCRRNEILPLQWQDVDLDAGELSLKDTKTDARTVPLHWSRLVVSAGVGPGGPDSAPWVWARASPPGARCRPAQTSSAAARRTARRPAARKRVEPRGAGRRAAPLPPSPPMPAPLASVPPPCHPAARAALAMVHSRGFRLTPDNCCYRASNFRTLSMDPEAYPCA